MNSGFELYVPFYYIPQLTNLGEVVTHEVVCLFCFFFPFSVSFPELNGLI